MLPRTLALILFATSLLAAEPDKLTKLRGSYESAMTKATAPIQKTYTTELEKLKIEFTKAGKLEDALAIDGELKRIAELTSQEPSAGTKSKLATWIVGTVWRPNETSSKSITFTSQKHFEYLDSADGTKKEAKYTIERGILYLLWTDLPGDKKKCELAEDQMSFTEGKANSWRRFKQ